MKKIVLGLSGGMDSATMLAIFLDRGYEVHACSFYYGSKHGKWEQQAAKEIIEHYKEIGIPIVHHLIDLSVAFKDFNSNLLLSGGEIPEGHYNDQSMSQTVVPGRNMIFSSIMAGLAESIEAEAIALGVHQGDHHIYPDCRKEFIKAFDSAIYLSSDRKIQVLTPLVDDTKTTLLLKGLKLHVPYRLTRTCYKDQELACGRCGSCRERLESFQNCGIPDPIQYEI